MTPEEIERHAMHAEPLPTGLNQPEQLLFQSFRCLYQSYRSGTITREQAQVEKKALLSWSNDNRRWDQICRNTCEARVKLGGMSREV